MFVPIKTTSIQKIDIVNAKASKRIIIDVTGKQQSYEYVIYNCKGKK